MLLKPAKPHDNHDDVDTAEITDDWDNVKVYLLVCFESVDVDAEQMDVCECSGQTDTGLKSIDVRIETRLRGRTGAEEEGVYRSEIPVRVDDGETENGEGNDPCICAYIE